MSTMSEETEIARLIEQAKAGSQDALDAIIRQIQDRIYNLALRMLLEPADAQDATQEILIKVVTHLSEFRQESAFSTWVYRIATNYLLTTRKRRAEQGYLTFERLGKYLDESLALGASAIPDGYDQRVLVEEIGLSCTLGMLICLDRVSRIAYILGEIFEVSSEEGAAIMETTPAAFRQRLSRARTRIRAFVQQQCGIVNPANPCRCSKHVGNKIRAGLLKPDKLQYAATTRAVPFEEAVYTYAKEVKELDRTAALFRVHQSYAAPESVVEGIKRLLRTGRFGIFS